MPSALTKYALPALKALLTLVFAAAGGAKLVGVEMMVDIYEAIGVGQWFRYLTGVFEAGGAALLWLPGRQAYGAALLTVTMIGAVIADAFVLNQTIVPALVLGLLSALVLYAHRGQLPGRR